MNDLFFRYESTVKSVEGMLTANVHETQGDDAKEIFFVELSCENKYTDKVPYGMTIISDEGKLFL